MALVAQALCPPPYRAVGYSYTLSLFVFEVQHPIALYPPIWTPMIGPIALTFVKCNHTLPVCCLISCMRIAERLDQRARMGFSLQKQEHCHANAIALRSLFWRGAWALQKAQTRIGLWSKTRHRMTPFVSAEGPDQHGLLEQDWRHNHAIAQRPLCFCLRRRPEWAIGARLERERRSTGQSEQDYALVYSDPFVFAQGPTRPGSQSKTTERTTPQCSDLLCFSDQHGLFLEQDQRQNSAIVQRCLCLRPRPRPDWPFGARLQKEQPYCVATPFVSAEGPDQHGLWRETTKKTTLQYSDPLCFCRRLRRAWAFSSETTERTTLQCSDHLCLCPRPRPASVLGRGSRKHNAIVQRPPFFRPFWGSLPLCLLQFQRPGSPSLSEWNRSAIPLTMPEHRLLYPLPF